MLTSSHEIKAVVNDTEVLNYHYLKICSVSMRLFFKNKYNYFLFKILSKVIYEAQSIMQHKMN